MELELIVLAARGVMSAEQVDAVPAERFTTASKLFAWTCAAGACVRLGGRSNFHAVRFMRVTAPRLDLPLGEWAALNRATDDVIDEAERLDEERSRQAAERGES